MSTSSIKCRRPNARMGDSMNKKDVRIDTFSGGPHANISVRLIHLPTLIAVEATGKSPVKLRKDLFETLEEKVADLDKR